MREEAPAAVMVVTAVGEKEAPGVEVQAAAACAHPHGELGWELDCCEEAGWTCYRCHATLGYRPDLDRACTTLKVSAILHAMHDADLTYVSNSTMGETVIAGVSRRCRRDDTYDQESIVRFILVHPDMDSRAFWRKEARAWLSVHEQSAGPPAGETGAR